MIRGIIELLLIFFWLFVLRRTDSIFEVYIILAIIAVICRTVFVRKKESVVASWPDRIYSALFSFMICAANYRIFSVGGVKGVLFALIAFVGGYICARYIIAWCRTFASRFMFKKYEYKMRPRTVFLLVFGAIAVINLLILFVCCYPGVLTADSVNQLSQLDAGAFTNHHPFLHTMTIGVFYKLGYLLFNDHYAAIATYSVFQILAMAAIFAYAVMTVYQLKVNRKITIAMAIFFAIAPYHICYSFSIWKDVLFGGGVLLFVVACYRYFMAIGSKRMSFVLAILGAFLLCLFRSNGLFVFLVLLAIFWVVFRKKYLKLGIAFSVVAVFAVVMNFSALPAFGVKKANTVEAYSIPLQQIARVIYDERELSAEQYEKLSRIMDVEEVKKVYLNFISDPVKIAVINGGGMEYMNEHIVDYAKLWAEIGMRHPVEYAKAHIDETRGYWGGGYYWWVWLLQNDLDPSERYNNSLPQKAFNGYLDLFYAFKPLRAMMGIGLFTWISLLVIYVAHKKKNRHVLFLTLPLVGIIGTLFIATPVFAEFRYSYALFCCLPFLVVALFVKQTKRRA